MTFRLELPEVMKVLRAKKYAKSKKPLPELEEKPETASEKRSAGGEVEDTEKNKQVTQLVSFLNEN